MRYHKLDLNLLVPLRALLLEKNVTRAARGLHITQSAMSGILARLRAYFDDPLIVVVGRRMELTPLGESMVPTISDLLMRIDATLDTRPGFDPGTAQHSFSIVASDYVVSVLLADVLQRVHQMAPGVSVQVRLPGSRSAAELEAGDLDLLVTPAEFASAEQASCLLFRDAYCAVADPTHWPLGDAISLAQYLSLRHAVYDSQGKPHFDAWFDRTHGDRRQVEVKVHSFQQLPLVVAGTARIATMHTRMARRFASATGLKLVRLDFEVPAIEEVLQWHRLRELQPAGRWLRELIEAQARQMPPAA